jgi:TolA-binding protein
MSHCVEDLIVKARRGQLSPEEAQQLRLAVDASTEARLLYEAGVAFDGESPVAPGDEALIARLGDRAVKPRRRRGKKRWSALMAVAAVFVASTATGGGWYALRGILRPSAPKPAAVASAAVSASPTRTAPRRRARIAAPRERDALEQPVPAPSAVFAVPHSGEVSAPPRAGSRELFAKANQARREGRTTEAIQAYEELQLQYPQSAGAKHADLSLAELYLQRGSADAALARFRLYSGGPLKAEALWGEARALRQLGRIQEECQALETLVQQYPGSAYATAARKRLEEVGG